MMGKGKKIKWFAAIIMMITVTTAMSVYAGPAAESEDYMDIDGADSIWDYEGTITDEMIEKLEGGYDTESPTDLYGNELGWETQGSGSEDEAGYETSADMMEAPTYSEKEQEEILEDFWTGNGAEAGETENMGTGLLRINGNLGDDWPGYNIIVALYNGSYKRMEVTLYSQDDFRAKKELPAGTYKVYRAYVPGDENGNRYPLLASNSSIEIEQDKIVEITVWRAVDMDMGKEITEPGGQEETESEKFPVKASADRKAAVGIGIVLLFLVSGAIVYRKKTNHHRYQ